MTRSDPQDAFRRNYRAAFLRYLPSHAEPALATAYRLGRDALTGDITLLDLVRIHHDVLAQTLATAPADEVPDVIDAAADFLAEALAAADMAQRSLHR
ncbi:MAG: hypothetical protein J2P23_06255 [Microlunatus sp.]|nr:hypothetical protein [Microlunatus sp.]